MKNSQKFNEKVIIKFDITFIASILIKQIFQIFELSKDASNIKNTIILLRDDEYFDLGKFHKKVNHFIEKYQIFHPENILDDNDIPLFFIENKKQCVGILNYLLDIFYECVIIGEEDRPNKYNRLINDSYTDKHLICLVTHLSAAMLYVDELIDTEIEE